MGNTSSLENTDPDPWWNQHQPHNNQNESQQTSSVESEITSSVSHETTRAQEDTKSLHEMWYQREQTLGQTIQHLAEENMRLSSARRSAEKRLQEFEAETQNTSEELDKLRSEAEKAQQVFEKLHAQIQSGREDRQMITSEMERIRSGFDAEREAKEQLLSEMRILREQRDENKRTAEFLNEQLKQKAQLVEKSMASFNQERREKECIMNELEKRKDELKATKTSLASATDSLKVQELSDNNSRLLPKESSASEESACARIRSPEAMAEMVRFQAEMSMRREARQRAMQAVSSEMERLRSELNAEREAREQAMHNLEQAKLQPGKTEKTKREETLEVELEQVQQKIKSDKKKIKELSQENERLQFELMNSREALTERNDELEKLQTQMETGRQQMQHQIDALKEVATICKEMLNIREGQVLHLTEKLKTIEVSVTKRVPEKLPVDLKIEYETQMENIRSLKALYEERMKLMMSEKEKLVQDSEEKSQRLDTEMKRSEELEQKITDMKLALEEKEEENSNLQIQLDDSHDKSNGLAKELTLINNLFTQMLIGSSATEMDLDRLTRLLQENHDLITDITIKEDSSEIAAVLPKLILDLVNQADSGTVSSASTPTEERNEDVHGDEGSTPEPEAQNDAPGESSASPNKTPEESVNGMAVHDIALNLPKVWKVLLELLSHHIAPSASEDQEEKQNSCYKSIDTPSGPRLVVSVSQTFLRLKDLILEKKSLQKELSRLKQLNGHLERKLNGQEQKLSVVSTELRKTWNVVDQMQTQHQKLHTHEKILRYELHEKRKMLNELKQELEYCREKWERARQKNSESEVEWRKLRKEFALRKKHPNDVLNNSGESGFLDERGDDSCEDDDTSAKDTGQLDPGIEEISGTEDIRTSSPIETGFSESNSLMDSSRMHTSSPIPNQEEILNQSQSELILDLESNELTNTVASQMPNNNHQSTFPSESSIHASDLCLSSFGPLKNNSDQKNLTDCNINSPYNNCSTISIITLLKHQLAFFSRNLDEFSTSSNMTSQNLEALESIFSLPPIQIPKALNDKITVQNCFHNYFAKNFEQEDIQDFSAYSVPSTSSLHNSTFDSRETENRISEDRSGDITAGTTLNTTDVNTKLPVPSASTPHNSTFDSRETENRIPDRSSTNAPVGINTPLKDTKGSDLDSSDTSTPTKTSEAQDQRINAHLPVLDACQAQSSKETTRANRTAEEIAEARAARLKRLEEQCQQLYNKVSRTTHRSTALCNRLEELHEQFRGSESPPGVRNDTTQSSEDNIPVAPPTPSSSENPTKSASSHSSCRISERKNIPTPPPLPNKLPTRRIETNAKSPQTDISNTQIPTPPPLLQQLPSQRIPSCIQMVQAGNGTVIPIPPPFPQSVRGRRLPTCMAEITNNTPDSQYSTDNCANESTTRHNDVQGQEELPQETNTVKLSTDANNETKDNGKH